MIVFCVCSLVAWLQKWNLGIIVSLNSARLQRHLLLNVSLLCIVAYGVHVSFWCRSIQEIHEFELQIEEILGMGDPRSEECCFSRTQEIPENFEPEGDSNPEVCDAGSFYLIGPKAAHILSKNRAKNQKYVWNVCRVALIIGRSKKLAL